MLKKISSSFNKQILLFLLILLSITSTINAQKADTTIVKQESQPVIQDPKNPKTALLLSILSGAGQFYNEKYYKIPLIYSTIGTLLFMAKTNNNLYQEFLIRYSSYGLPGPVKYYDDNIPKDILKKYKEYYRRNRDLLYISVFFVYTFNILDAVVDANMSYFDVGKDFAFKIKPKLLQTYTSKPGFGVSFAVSLK